MKKTILLLLIAVISFSSFSQTNSNSSLLWEISGKNLKQPSYLFGTVHMICKEDFFMPDVVRSKFSAAEEVFLELDMDDPSMMMKMMTMMQLPKGQTIKQLFGDTAAYAAFDKKYQKITGMSASMFNTYKPLMLMTMLTEKSLPCSTKESYEQTFMAIAVKEKKDIKGLETMEDQIAVFDGIPDSLEIANLQNMVNNFDKSIDEFKKLVAVYKQQDVEALYKFTASSPELMNAQNDLLVKRNNNWIPVMQKNMETKVCFFAVGAAHLGGDIGVINLLRKQGFTVKPVKL